MGLWSNIFSNAQVTRQVSLRQHDPCYSRNSKSGFRTISVYKFQVLSSLLFLRIVFMSFVFADSFSHMYTDTLIRF